VYRYAFRLTGSQADAEDLTQQTFLVAQQKLAQLRQPERAAGWLFAICRTCFLKARAKRRPQDGQVDVTELPAPAPEIGPVDSEQLQAALDELPDETRLILLLFYFEELSYREIARELDIPIGTVMSRLSRGKQRLRQRLAGEERPNDAGGHVARPAARHAPARSVL
jgi:RNA polymerase sigma-70 factor (ECF subfamily)